MAATMEVVESSLAQNLRLPVLNPCEEAMSDPAVRVAPGVTPRSLGTAVAADDWRANWNNQNSNNSECPDQRDTRMLLLVEIFSLLANDDDIPSAWSSDDPLVPSESRLAA
jgi:hypothetical protein